mgnify:CR=1 FL=1
MPTVCFILLLAAVAVLATAFTTDVRGTGIALPCTYPDAGYVVIVMERISGPKALWWL